LERDKIDLSEMEELLASRLATQLLGVHEDATGNKAAFLGGLKN
jgi:hypothetical protein